MATIGFAGYKCYKAKDNTFPKHFPFYICSVDCTHANTGLFFGIFVMVATIIALVVFFVLIESDDENLQTMAISVASCTELSLYSLTTMAVLFGMFQVSSHNNIVNP